MRIAIIAPPWLPVPPPAYGGTENVLDALARALKDLGHDVVLFTTGDSTCDVERRWTLERHVGVGAPGPVDELRHAIAAYESVADADVIHDHTLTGPVYASSLGGLAVVTTNHGPFDENLAPIYRALARRVPVVAISAHQASLAPDIPIAAVIHHGVRVEEFPVGSGDGGYALFLGRMHPSKGAHVAARVARAAGVPLRIAGKLLEPIEREYFDAKVRPLLGGDVTYLGEVGQADKLELLGQATCLLNPIAWPEPFGMVMVEALACGTPVVTTPHGAAPEIVEDGVVGFVRSGEAALAEAVADAAYLSRSACRKLAEERFSARRMALDHLRLYERVRSGELGLSSAPAAPGVRRAAPSAPDVATPVA
ncbi:MAG TPA: glycosyltransferase family 4 protein [Acidimicrobiales bacterium]|jgi:glycosyltransferase involved in cell wall biosynthesis|nr:glycosyltransferase family 4 protein [Acidimicrobiales bacterium]